jgi:hypothetical protein
MPLTMVRILLRVLGSGGSPLVVNVLKGKLWNEQSEFDATKDKTHFRQYETACDRVRAFYHEQHGGFFSY